MIHELSTQQPLVKTIFSCPGSVPTIKRKKIKEKFASEIFLKRQGVPQVFFFLIFGQTFFLETLLLDDWISLRETQNGKNRCLLLNLSIFNGLGW